MRSLYYSMNGEPLTMAEWAMLFEDTIGRTIGKTELQNGMSVSTVWVGIDHGFGRGDILIFETMVFPQEMSDHEQERYSTREQALAGHNRIVAKWRRRQTVSGKVEHLLGLIKKKSSPLVEELKKLWRDE